MSAASARAERRLGPVLEMAWLGLFALPILGVEHTLADPGEWLSYLVYSVPPVLGCAICVGWAERDPRVARAAAWAVGAFFFVVSAAFVASLLTLGHYPLYAHQAEFTDLPLAVGVVWNGVYLTTAAAVLAWLWTSRRLPEALQAPIDRVADALGEHLPVVRRYCLSRTGDVATADDLTQDVFVVALRRRDSFRGQAPMRSWLLGIAHNVVRTHHRDRTTAARAVARFASEPRHAPPPANPEVTLTTREQLEEVRRARRRLPVGQDRALGLRFDAELSSAEAAEQLGCTPGAFRVRLHRALTALRKLTGQR